MSSKGGRMSSKAGAITLFSGGDREVPDAKAEPTERDLAGNPAADGLLSAEKHGDVCACFRSCD